MGLPWSTADTPEEDVGHALEGTAFQGVSVFVIPRSILGTPGGWPPPSHASHTHEPRPRRRAGGGVRGEVGHGDHTPRIEHRRETHATLTTRTDAQSGSKW